MGLVTIRTARKVREERRLLHNGLKPFFLLASAFSVLSMVAWTAIYTFRLIPADLPFSLFAWHAHELVYGFAVAVVAGFLLAALPEWTNVATVRGYKLALLLGVWAVPRFVFLSTPRFLPVAAVCDLLFSCGLAAAVAHPIVCSRSWRQSGVLSKVLLLGSGNLCFYLGAFGVFPDGIQLSLYGGLYLIVSLILTVGGRVMPGFIQNGVDYPVSLSAPTWVSALSMVLFLVFFVVDLAQSDSSSSQYLALCLGVLTCVKLYRWHTPGIWTRPLLWGLYVSFASIAVGFWLLGTRSYTGISKTVALHAFTVGGIGMATLSMMVRAALGHYGGDVRNPPQQTAVALVLLLVAEVFRVILPIVFPAYYGILIAVSQVGWIVAYGLLTVMLVRIFSSEPRK